jgi:hypothetical protein
MVRLFDKAPLSGAEGLTAHPERLNLKLPCPEMKAVFSKKLIVKRKFQYNID